MNTKVSENVKIYALVREIQGADEMMRMHNSDHPTDKVMAFQYQHMRNNLIKELLAILIQSDFGVPMFDDLIKKMLGLLKQPEKPIGVSTELRERLKGLERALAA